MRSEKEINDILDRVEIAEVMYKYADSQDRRDWELYATCFSKDVRCRIEELGINDQGVDAVIASAKRILEAMPLTQHVIATPNIHVQGDEADGTFYVHATHILQDGRRVAVGARYTEKFARLQGEWRITDHSVPPLWSDDDGRMVGDIKESSH
jgi:ketosteroid isomerase-like protein